ncbi:MAG: alpha/beta fold hydrolase [Pseudomonadota bacterium]
MRATLPGGLELAYEEFGDRDAPALVLIMGLGTQMIAWPEALCEALAAAGLRVIRFDNRDVGLSTRFDGVPAPGPVKLQFMKLLRRRVEVPYTLDDMAADAVGLLDALGIESAHVAGASMGGMIAQLVALKHPARVRSLCSIMSTTGNASLPGPAFRVTRHMFLSRPPAGDRERYVQHAVKTLRLIDGPGFPTTEAESRAMVERHLARAHYPEGFRRHLAAILVAADRSEALTALATPTLVVHGTHDPLIPAEAGRHTAEQVPGARLELIEGMGHIMPDSLCPTLASLMAGHALA